MRHDPYHCTDHTTCEELIKSLHDEIEAYRQALLPFAEAAGRAQLLDCTSGKPLPDDVFLGTCVKTFAWKQAVNLINS